MCEFFGVRIVFSIFVFFRLFFKLKIALFLSRASNIPDNIACSGLTPFQ